MEAMPPPHLSGHHHLPKKIKDAIDRFLDAHFNGKQYGFSALITKAFKEVYYREGEASNIELGNLYSIQYETRILIHVFFLLSSLKFSNRSAAMLENFNEDKRKNSMTQFSDFHTGWEYKQIPKCNLQAS